MSGDFLQMSLLILIAAILVIIAFATISLMFYFIGAIGLYKMAKGIDLENSWLAFIPVINLYIVGKIVKNVKVFSIEITQMEWVLPLSILFSASILSIPVWGHILVLIATVLHFIALYKLFKMYTKKGAFWMMVSCIFTGNLAANVYYFRFRNQKPICLDEQRKNKTVI